MGTLRKQARENGVRSKRQPNARQRLFTFCLPALLLSACVAFATVSVQARNNRFVLGWMQGIVLLDKAAWHRSTCNAVSMLSNTGGWWVEHVRLFAKSVSTMVDKHLPPTGFGQGRKVPHNKVSKNTNMEIRLQALIQEAKRVAEEQGIFTEAGAAERKKEREQREKGSWGYLLTSKGDWLGDKLSRVTRRVCTDGDTVSKNRSHGCGPGGVCVDGSCLCAVAYSGIVCGHSKFAMVRITESVHHAGVPLGFAGHFIQQKNGYGDDEHLIQYLDDEYLYGQCSVALGIEGVQTGKLDGGAIRASQQRGDELLVYMVSGTEMLSSVVCTHRKDDMSCDDPIEILLREEGIEGRKKAVVLDAEFQRHVGDLFPNASKEESELLLISTVIMSLNVCHKVSFMVRADAIDTFLHQAKTQHYGVLYTLLASDIVDLNLLE